MLTPRATYRVQLHKDFTLKDLAGNVDYLHSLGVSTIYAAPILEATPGSLHGYDVVNPHIVNPEIGTLDDLRRIAKKLKARNMTWVQDIVPNHMAFHPLNYRLMDVLERREWSPYYRYFDIDWQHAAPHLNGKVQVPFLGTPLQECIDESQISISFSENGFTVDYSGTSWPLSLPAYAVLFDGAGETGFAWQDLVTMGEKSSDCIDWKKDKESYLSSVFNDEKSRQAIQVFLETLNADPARLQRILDSLYYRLTWWKDTDREINYRRFFTVNELICLRMEDENVFNEYHGFIYSLYREKLIQGLRIDHIDGLQDPLTYTRRLRNLFGDDCYIIAEKILESNEDLPEQWPLQGTSGYEFLSFVNQLVTNRRGAREMVAFYLELVPDLLPYKDLVHANKRLILEKYMRGEWNNLVEYFCSLGLNSVYSQQEIREALGMVMVSMPVYRVYPAAVPLKGEALRVINEAFASLEVKEEQTKTVLEYIHRLFTIPQEDEDHRKNILAFIRRFMQFTGPLTAKGVEDTTFYVYNALISHDEVGDAPSQLGISIGHFHSKMLDRQNHNPFSLNATATHDTKRGEDARLRLNLLCEFPQEWKTEVLGWMQLNTQFREKLNGKTAPTVNDEYYLYQAILGGFPADLTITPEWIDRLVAYEVKVLREAKVNSNWANPDENYEKACERFIRKILEPESTFVQQFRPFLENVLVEANRYALTQVAIKITAPGIPDIYQGCELWDLSFVDPDNRRPVDYRTRQELLTQIGEIEKEGVDQLFTFLHDNRASGIQKLYTTWKLLSFRNAHPEIFARGEYHPLPCEGDGQATVAFARRLGNDWVAVIVPLQSQPAGGSARNREILFPEQGPSRWVDLFTKRTYQHSGKLTVANLCRDFPLALLFGST